MDYSKIKVLLLEGYARQSLPLIRSFKKHGCEVSVLCNSKLDVAYASRLPDHKILGVCNTENYEDTVKCVRELLINGKYDLVVPLVDFSARVLSENKSEFSKYAIVASNDKSVFNTAQDKLEVMRVCIENGIPCPKTLFNLETHEDILNANMQFPIVVKPRRGCGARGFHRFDTLRELELFMKNNSIDLKQYVVQEFIPQDDLNLSANLFVDNIGNVMSNFVYGSYRWFPLKGGTGTFNITVNRPDIQETCAKLIKLINLRGCCGVDLIHDPRDGIAKILEINPRIMACAKIGFMSGIDLAQQILEKEFCQVVTPMMEYKKDVRVRMSQTDILWFLKSQDRFRAKPSFFSCKNTTDQTFSWDDPLPWFAFLFHGLRRFNSEMNLRK